MINRTFFPLLLVGMTIGCLFATDAVFARSAGTDHFVAHHPTFPPRHHMPGRTLLVPYYYGYGSVYEPAYAPPDESPPPPAQVQKSVEEPRRVCEPQTYKVPTANGGESQVTVVRC
ncbi:MAG TPA: hypothetical protein VMH84_11510 [Xanthobacteraceae bacterium]|nr:hypothetical protein [Xanthobacteraceae bacterium]